MLLPNSRLDAMPVMGLQTGSELARTSGAVIDPGRLQILAYTLSGPLVGGTRMLRIADVRELSDLGFIVDSSDEFIEPDDVIKLKEIYDLHFVLIGMPVIDEHKHKLGKVDGYTIDSNSFLIQQLQVRRSLLRSLNDTQLLVHRSQIVEINDNEIIVKSGEKKQQAAIVEAVRPVMDNPFRSAQPEQIDQE